MSPLLMAGAAATAIFAAPVAAAENIVAITNTSITHFVPQDPGGSGCANGTCGNGGPGGGSGCTANGTCGYGGPQGGGGCVPGVGCFNWGQ